MTMATSRCLKVKDFFYVLSCLHFFVLDSQRDPFKSGLKKKPDNIKFPPYTQVPQSQTKKKDCQDEETIGEEKETITSSSTTTATPDNVMANSESVLSVDSDDSGESSVAESKPVGLAIAGQGGVASSKPVAQSIVGLGGFAIGKKG